MPGAGWRELPRGIQVDGEDRGQGDGVQLLQGVDLVCGGGFQGGARSSLWGGRDQREGEEGGRPVDRGV